MQKAWREYLEFAAGATHVSRKEAARLAKKLLGKGGATAGQLQSLAADLVATSAANREALAKLVRFEVDRALGAVGLATAEEVEELTARVHDLERQLREAKSAGLAEPMAEPGVEVAVEAAEPSPPAATKVPAKKTTKAVAKKATKTVAKRSTAAKAVVKKASPRDSAGTPSAAIVPAPAGARARKATKKAAKSVPGTDQDSA